MSNSAKSTEKNDRILMENVEVMCMHDTNSDMIQKIMEIKNAIKKLKEKNRIKTKEKTLKEKMKYMKRISEKKIIKNILK